MTDTTEVGALPGRGRMAVTIVNWNTRDLLRRCLVSVLAEAPPEVVVIDNGSTDGSAEMVGQEFPSVGLTILPHNPGYGAGCNVGIRASRADYILVLNSDTTVLPGALHALTEILDREPRAAVVGPRVLNPDGSPQRSYYPFPGPGARIFVPEPVARLAALIPVLRERYLADWRGQRVRRVPWVVGAAFAVRRSAYEEVGGIDESFEMYFEEADFCWRLRDRGWDALFAPVTAVVHVGGASTSQRRSAMRARFELSRMQFYWRYRRGLTLRLAIAIVRLHTATLLLRDAVHYRLSANDARRGRLAEDLSAWRQVMASSSPGH